MPSLLVLTEEFSVLLFKVAHCVRACYTSALSLTLGLCPSGSHSASAQSSLAAALDLWDLSICVKLLFERHFYSVYTHSCDLMQPHDLLNTT